MPTVATLVAEIVTRGAKQTQDTIRDVGDAGRRAGRRIQDANDRIQRSFQGVASSTGNAFRTLGDRINHFARNARARIDSVTESIRRWREEARKARREQEKFDSRSGYRRGQQSGIGGTFGAVAGIGGAAAIGLAFREAGRAYLDFEQSVAGLSAITGITGEGLKTLSDNAREVGRVTNKTAAQVAAATKTVAAKMPQLLELPEQIAEIIDKATTLAVAAETDIPTAAGVLAGTMNQFKAGVDQVDRFTNALAAATRYGSVELPQLAISMGNVGSAAYEVGLSLEEALAGIEIIGKEADVSGARASIALRNMLLRLERQLADDLRPSVVGVEQALLNLNASAFTIPQTMKLFEIETANMASALIAFAKNYANTVENISHTQIAVEQSLIRLNTTSGDFLKFLSTIQEYVIRIGERLAPAFRDIITGWDESLSNMLDDEDRMIRFGRLMANIADLMANFAKTVLIAGGALHNFFSLVTSVMESARNPLSDWLTDSAEKNRILNNVKDFKEDIINELISQGETYRAARLQAKTIGEEFKEQLFAEAGFENKPNWLGDNWERVGEYAGESFGDGFLKNSNREISENLTFLMKSLGKDYNQFTKAFDEAIEGSYLDSKKMADVRRGIIAMRSFFDDETFNKLVPDFSMFDKIEKKAKKTGKVVGFALSGQEDPAAIAKRKGIQASQRMEEQYRSEGDTIEEYALRVKYAQEQLQALGSGGEKAFEKIKRNQNIEDEVRDIDNYVTGLEMADKQAAELSEKTEHVEQATKRMAEVWQKHFTTPVPHDLRKGLEWLAASAISAEDKIADLTNTTDNMLEQIKDAANDVGREIEDVFVEMRKTGEFEISRLVDAILDEFMRLSVRRFISEPIFGSSGVIQDAISSFMSGGGKGVSAGSLNSMQFQYPSTKGYASGGVISGRQYFNHSSGRGVMGEKGWEGIFPLFRNSRGQLGVGSAGGGTDVTIIDQRGANSPPIEQESSNINGRQQIKFLIRQEMKSAYNDGSMDPELGTNYGMRRIGIRR